MLTVILFRCGLQLVSDEKLLAHPALKRVRLEGRTGTPALLDLGLVHGAVSDLQLKESGRPDIVHSAIKSVTDTPYWAGHGVKLIIHTIEDRVWEIDREWRVPANYLRFFWLMERFLQEGSLSFADRKMVLREQTAHGLLDEIEQKGGRPAVFLLSRSGKQQGLQHLVQLIKKENNPVVIVGCYQRGSAIIELEESLAGKYQVNSWKIADKGLLTATVLSRLFFGLEFL
ncbi:MAG: hypothetical protein ACFFD4_02750 [Candidatus Odinarchaeota archaeon]